MFELFVIIFTSIALAIGLIGMVIPRNIKPELPPQLRDDGSGVSLSDESYWRYEDRNY